MLDFLKQLTDPESIISYGGLALLLVVVFAETGLLIGFFLPGDSLIFISGLICVSKPHLLDTTIFPLILMLCLAAIAGNIVGYWFGYSVGPPLFKKEDSIIFKKKYLILTQNFYTKHGGKAIILGRFFPIIRTFVPILAGVININFYKFMIYNVLGAIFWIFSLCSAGYYLGQYDWVKQNIEFIVIGLIIITAIPLIVGVYKNKRNSTVN